MSGKWEKLGLLYCPAVAPRHPKLATHAANPLPVLLTGDIYRIFYSGRDGENRSSIGAVDIDIVKREIVQDRLAPFFQHGPRGSFYADGVSIGNCYEAGGVTYMLFMGWQAPEDGHWRGDIGKLVLRNDMTLELEAATPFLGCDAEDQVSLSYPWVAGSGSDGFRMWYGSTVAWDAGNGEMLHVIKHASSVDGHHWTRHGIAVPYALGRAQAFSRPTVAGNAATGFEMWFSYRSGSGEKYRIGHARSDDGAKWEIYPEGPAIGTSSAGWDSEMTEYPFVFDHKGVRYMLYNGNGYGKTGFGLAKLCS